jgi:hypothetical protein
VPNTYGNNGNRWWVGYNTAQGDLAKFPSLSGPSGYEALPSKNATDDALFVKARAKWAAGHHANTDTTSVENINWLIPGGPYTSKAAAVAAIPAIQKAAPAPGAVSQATQAVTNAVPGLSQIGTFFSDLGQANTWIRVAEVILGVALIGIGIAHITKVDNVVSKAVKIGSKGLV